MQDCLKLMTVSTTVSQISFKAINHHFIVSIRGSDLAHLKQIWVANDIQDCWVNDNVINGYMLLICNLAKKVNVSNNSHLVYT